MQHKDLPPWSNILPCMQSMRPPHMLRRNMKGLAKAASVLLAVAAAALICTAAAAAPRSSPASCREAANGLVSLLDGKQDDTALYRDTYAVVVNTCGPAARAPRGAIPRSPAGRPQCRDLAAAMVGLIEDEKMNTAEFVKARNSFAAACVPR